MAENVLVVLPSLIQQADLLAKEHEHFNETYIVAGRAALYGLLQKIMKLYEDFDNCADKAALIKYLRTELAESYGIKTQENTSDAAVLVRYVTRADRKTAHVYARAIETAKANGIDSAGFVAYVQDKGGIERIRAIGVDPVLAASNEKAEHEARQNMWEFLRLRAERPFAKFKVAKGKLPGDTGREGLQYFVSVRKGDVYSVITALDVANDLELKLLEPLLQAVKERMAVDKDALIKMREMVRRKTTAEMIDQNPVEGETKCVA